MGIAVVGETPSLPKEFTGETHKVLECTQAYLPGNKHQKGPIYLWVAGNVSERELSAKQVASFPL